MIENVEYLTRSLWGEEKKVPKFKYPYKPDDGRESLQASEAILHVVRGGPTVSLMIGSEVQPLYRRYCDNATRLGARIIFSGLRLALVPERVLKANVRDYAGS
jgi:hypothetical protein